MSREHAVKPDAVETDPEKIRKLALFREEVKRDDAGSEAQRVYKEFDSLTEFALAATQSVAELRRLLDAQPTAAAPAPRPHRGGDRAAARPADLRHPDLITSGGALRGTCRGGVRGVPRSRRRAPSRG